MCIHTYIYIGTFTHSFIPFHSFHFIYSLICSCIHSFVHEFHHHSYIVSVLLTKGRCSLLLEIGALETVITGIGEGASSRLSASEIFGSRCIIREIRERRRSCKVISSICPAVDKVHELSCPYA